MMQSFIIQEKCKKCLICIDVCPAKIIAKQADGSVNFIAEKIHLCLSCGQCMAACASQAIQIDGFEYGKHIIPIQQHKIENQDFLNFLLARRSVRNFKKEPLKNEHVQYILQVINSVPYAVNPENIEFVFINKREVIEQALPLLSDFYDKLEKWIQHPFIRFMMKRKAPAETIKTIDEHLLPFMKVKHYQIPKNREKDNITRFAPAVLLVHAKKDAAYHTFDAHIALTYAMLAAHAIGVGATINGLIPAAINKEKELQQIFKVPEGHEAVGSLILGYPKYRYHSAIKRNPKSCVIID